MTAQYAALLPPRSIKQAREYLPDRNSLERFKLPLFLQELIKRRQLPSRALAFLRLLPFHLSLSTVELTSTFAGSAGASLSAANRKVLSMSKLRVHGFAISLDGYGAGPDQGLDNPLGVGGIALHEWVFPTRTFRQMSGQDGGTTGIDDEFAVRGFANIGAWIMGRNMFGPVRGPWPDDTWRGWWGDNPPYHVPVFVLTNHPRASITMDGGTTFHFVTDGVDAALKRATEAANLRVGLIDEMHLAVAPILLGSGEHLFAGIDTPKLGYQRTEHVATPNATHVVLTRRS
jgi:dihydrofolate reductase